MDLLTEAVIREERPGQDKCDPRPLEAETDGTAHRATDLTASTELNHKEDSKNAEADGDRDDSIVHTRALPPLTSHVRWFEASRSPT